MQQKDREKRKGLVKTAIGYGLDVTKRGECHVYAAEGVETDGSASTRGGRDGLTALRAQLSSVSEHTGHFQSHGYGHWALNAFPVQRRGQRSKQGSRHGCPGQRARGREASPLEGVFGKTDPACSAG
jgi:hypothetical protein